MPWAKVKTDEFFTKNGQFVKMKGLFAAVNIPKFTIIGNYNGDLITEYEYSEMAAEINKNTTMTGTEYGIEHVILKDPQNRPLIIFPVDVQTGKRADKYKNVIALYANEPTTYRKTKHGRLLEMTENAFLVVNYDTTSMSLMSNRKINKGDRISWCYGSVYDRRGYKPNCPKPTSWVYMFRGNIVQMPKVISSKNKPRVLKRNKQSPVTFKWDTDNWLEIYK